MAKKLFNVSPGLLILPNGKEIHPGEGIDLPKEYADNAGVASWVADGLASYNPAPKAALDELTATKVERDDLAAKVAELTALLAAATAPAKE